MSAHYSWISRCLVVSLLAVFALSCSDADSALQRCEPSAIVSHVLVDDDAVDCGELSEDASPDDIGEAAACVRDASSDQRPFRLIWRAAGIDSIYGAGIAAKADGSNLRVFRFYFDKGAEDSAAAWSECPSFSVRENCPARLDDCFECERVDDCTCTLGAAEPIQCRL